jgi:hypothetical protein
MFLSGLQMCTNEITIVGIFFFLNFEYGGANVTDLFLSCDRYISVVITMQFYF